MKKAALALSLSIVMLLVATALCLPGMCGCVSWIGVPQSDFSGIVAMLLYGLSILGIVISISWLAFVAVRCAVRRIRNA